LGIGSRISATVGRFSSSSSIGVGAFNISVFSPRGARAGARGAAVGMA
jgi:hypothetical protein